MKKRSIWLDNIKFDNPKVLDKNKEVDVLIIGGGITGLSTAYHLINSGLKVCLAEKNLIAHGVTSRTTGKLTYLQDNIYSKLKDKASLYYESQKDAIKIVEDIINNNNIECDYTKVDSYIFIDKYSGIDKIKKEKYSLDKLNIAYNTSNNLPINIPCKYTIKVNGTSVFHPIKYLVALKKIIIDNKIEVYENSTVTEIKKNKAYYLCKVNNNIIKTKKIVIATHYPFFLIPYLFSLKTYLEKSYISASKINNNKYFSAISLSKPIKSIRYHNKYLIYLTVTHNLCNKYNNKNNFNNLLNDLKLLDLKPEYIWSNHDIITEDNLPYIGFIENNLLIGTGYNTWGMTNGSLAGVILSDLILGRENKYKNLFGPKRNKRFNVLKYPLYIGYSVKSIIENKVVKNKSWYSKRVKFTKIDGKSVGIYIDEKNKEHIVYNLCPHLKCSLIFNEAEKTWDCPCHGSRFDIQGNSITGPSKYNIKYKK